MPQGEDAAREAWIDLIRHGEPVGGRRYRGQQDDPLSETGWAQMRAAVGGEPVWDRIVTSPLRRCAEFGAWLGSECGIVVKREPRLMEVGLGAWEGLTPDEVRRREPELLEAYLADPVRHRPEGAEALDAFAERVGRAWREIVSSAAGQRVLLITHAGVIRAVVCRILDIPLHKMFRLQVANAGLTRIALLGQPARPVLAFHNRPPRR